MPVITEQLNGGLVTARHPSLLREGELQEANNIMYRPNTGAAYKVPGRSTFGVVNSGQAVKGARYLSFEGSDSDVIVAYSQSKLFSAPYTGSTGTFTELIQGGPYPNAGTPNEILDSIYYGNQHFLIFGAGGALGESALRSISYLRPFAASMVCSTTLNDTTVTTAVAGGFSGVQIGQSVTGTNISSGTVVQSITSSTEIELSKIATGNGTPTLTFAGTPTLQVRYAGMKPVTAFGNNGATSAAIIAGTSSGVTVTTGAWSTTSDLGVGYYYFAYTEMILNGEEELIESTISIPSTSLPFINITTPASQGVAVCFELPFNSGTGGTNRATHYQLYMSDKQVDALPAPSLATYRRVGSPIAITAYSGTKQRYTLTESAVGTQGFALPATSSPVPSGYASWNNPDAFKGYTIFADAEGDDAPLAGNYLDDFGFSIAAPYDTASITGIEVAFDADVTDDEAGIVFFRLENAAGTKVSAPIGAYITGRRGYMVGGNNNTWGVTWSGTDFANNDFRIAVTRGFDGTNTRVYIRGVRVKIYYSGTTINRNGKFLPTITIQSQVGVAVSTGANFPPPIPSTGDTFEGHLVLNDIQSPGEVSYSLPGSPEYFPALYKLRFNTDRKDTVTCIKRVNRALVVGLDNAIKRVNYLPIESDPEFREGRAIEDITVDHGIVGPLAATTFTIPGGGIALAYLSHNGPHMTDSITDTTLNEDLDWTALIEPAYLKYAIMEDVPQLYQLRMYYTPAGGTTNTKALYFHYHPKHMKADGKLPVTGPVDVSARCAFPAWLTGVPKSFTGHNTNGTIYLEDRAADADQYVDDSGGTIVPSIRTRQIRFNGPGGEARVERLWLLTRAAGSSTTGACTLQPKIQNMSEAIYSGTQKTFSTEVGGLQVIHSDEYGEAIDYTISKSGSHTVAMVIEHIGYFAESPSMETNQKGT